MTQCRRLPDQGPAGGGKSGPNPTDRAKQGTKHSLLVEAAGLPVALVVAGATSNNHKLLGPTLARLRTCQPSRILCVSPNQIKLLASTTLLERPVMNPLARVLYIEDQPAVGATILLELRRARVEVTTAHNAERGLELARQNQFDLILLDALLSGTTGFEVCRLLKKSEHLKDLPVIFFTGVPNPQDRKEAIRLGAVAYLDKGTDTSQLAERILIAVEAARAAASDQEQDRAA